MVGSGGQTTNANEPSRLIIIKENSLLEKLFSSKEERTFLHIHKILGVTCLVSFAYRYAHLGQADGNFGPNFGTLFFIFHHWLLHVSSFIFDIPKKRILGGYRIWPEYRWHALGFACRHLSLMLLMWLEEMNGIPPFSEQGYHEMDLLIILANSAWADLGSFLAGPNHSSTIRQASFSDPFEAHFASEMQIYVTAFLLIGYRRYTVHLMVVSVIQINAFMMTLRRKNAAPQNVLTAIYSLMLVGAIVNIAYEDQFTHRMDVGVTIGSIAVILRMGFGVNKYLLWTVLWLVWNHVRMKGILPYYNAPFWFYGMVITKTICTSLGLVKRWRILSRSNDKNGKKDVVKKNPLVGFLALAINAGLFAFRYCVNFVHLS